MRTALLILFSMKKSAAACGQDIRDFEKDNL